MSNPNTCAQNIRQTSDKLVIEFIYGSKNVAEHDMESIKNCYGSDKVTISGSTVTVTLPIH